MEKMSTQTPASPTSPRRLTSSVPPELETLRIDVDGEIGTLTLDRPDSLNAMSPQMIGELVEAFAWLADLAPLRALIITGAERAFSAGGDVTWFREGVESEEIDLPSNVRRGAEVLHQAIVSSPISSGLIALSESGRSRVRVPISPSTSIDSVASSGGEGTVAVLIAAKASSNGHGSGGGEP